MNKKMRTLMLALLVVITSACGQAGQESSDTLASTTPTATPMNYQVVSNCPSSITDAVVTVTSNTITAPYGVSFADFGFPVENVFLGSHTPVSGMVAGVSRSCVLPRATEAVHPHHASSMMVYSCSENGVELCQVQFSLIVE